MPTQAPPVAGRPPSMGTDKSTARRATEDDEARPYVIVSDIGKGSFATVYKGYHEVCNMLPLFSCLRFHGAWQETHQTVAIKSVRKDILNAKLLDNLQSEIEILKSLSHRHITKLIDIVVRGIPLLNIMVWIIAKSLSPSAAFHDIASHFLSLLFLVWKQQVLRWTHQPFLSEQNETYISSWNIARAETSPTTSRNAAALRVLNMHRPQELHYSTIPIQGQAVLTR